MTKHPLVSILVPMYNAEKYFSETIESILGQTYKNIEIIIVDDESNDGSLALARKYENLHEHIQVYTQENSGAASARNQAFSYSKGDYIQYFDADDIMHSEKISSQVQRLSEYDFDQNIVATGKWTRFFKSTNTLRFPSLVVYKDYDNGLLFLKEAWSHFDYMIGQSWLIPRKLNEKVGGWNSNISVNDDGEFFARVAHSANKILFVPESIVYWRQENSISLSKNISRKGMESHLLVCDNYVKIIQKDLNYNGLKHALAMQYSKFIYRAYPMYPDLVTKAESELEKLGFFAPLPMPTKKFRLTAKLIGFYPTARLFGFKDRLVKKIRAIKDSKKWK